MIKRVTSFSHKIEQPLAYITTLFLGAHNIVLAYIVLHRYLQSLNIHTATKRGVSVFLDKQPIR